MASPNCWKCLSRPSSISLPYSRLPASVTSFSTTARRDAMPKVTKPQKAEKGTKTLRLKKKVVVKTGKPPMPGERKAMRKRIVLSNTNALEVRGLRNLDADVVGEIIKGPAALKQTPGKTVEGEEAMVPEVPQSALVGSVIGLEGATVDSLRAVEAFKTTQGWGLFRRPALLIREESAELTKKMINAADTKQTLKLVLDGGRVTGKSMMLLHAMATAFVKRWVVLNIPEAQELISYATDYAALPGSQPTLWTQNVYTATWLGQIGKANNNVLQSLQVTKKHTLPIPLPEKTSLARLCELGARDPDVAWPVFQAFWSEITAEGRPPILLTLDGLSHTMRNSLYPDTENNPIHAHDLAIIQHFINHLSGTSTLPNGGAVIGAASRSHNPISKSMDLAIKQREERQAGKAVTQKDPFEKEYDERVEKAMQNLQVMRLKGLSKVEARGLMEYWAQSGVLRSRVDEKTVAEKWALAGNGVVGEIQRGALTMRI